MTFQCESNSVSNNWKVIVVIVSYFVVGMRPRYVRFESYHSHIQHTINNAWALPKKMRVRALENLPKIFNIFKIVAIKATFNIIMIARWIPAFVNDIPTNLNHEKCLSDTIIKSNQTI